MALGDAVVGATHTPMLITWQDEDGDAWVLTGATITGTLRPERGGTTRAIAGTLVLVDSGDNGQFNWTFKTADLVIGKYWLQFKATFAGGAYDLSKKTEFEVLEAL